MGKFQALRAGGLTALVVGYALGCGGTTITSSGGVDGGGGSSASGGTKGTGGTSASGGAGGTNTSGGAGGSGGVVSGVGGTGGTSSTCTNPGNCYEKCTCAGASPSTCLTQCSASTTCGNGIIEGREECDGTNVGGETCAAATMGAAPNGTLRCTMSCTLDTTLCTSGGVCSPFGDSPGCQTCLDTYCCGQVKSCNADPSCAGFVQCARTCPDPKNTSDPCVQKCATGVSSTAISEWNSAVVCMASRCAVCNYL